MERPQKKLILKDLTKKMVFLVGPRQAGKTWLAKDIAKSYRHPIYLNYDHLEDRKIIQKEAWPEKTDLLILDELHKMPRWKTYLKGLYDTKPDSLHILVTGSARLDIFKKVGDSLAGRFFIHHLLPFSPSELKNTPFGKDLERFLVRGGFPEPFLAETDVDASRWRAQYVDSLLKTDVFEIEKIDHIRHMELLFELLRSRVGSPISYKSLAEDIGISPNTVKRYIRIFEALYMVFRVTPFSKNIARSLLKTPKLYFFDTGLVKGDIGARLENLVAVCLLKHVYANIDEAGKASALHYLRTKDGAEVDFAVATDGVIEKAFEVKHQDATVSAALKQFHEKYGFPAAQLVQELRKEYRDGKIDIRRIGSFLQEL